MNDSPGYSTLLSINSTLLSIDSTLLSIFGGLFVAGLVACTPSVGEYNAILRGDRAFAAGEMEEALAEYRLAVLEGSEEPEVYGRLAHTYALMGRVDEAADNYALAAERDSVWADQAVADLVSLARDAADQNDLYGVASAMQRALEFRPGMTVSDLALPLARHYFRSGQPGRALPLFQRALAAVPPDSAPAITYETALAYEEVGDCSRAVIFFEQYRETIPRWQRTEVNWHLGNCSFQYATTLLEEGRLESALRHLDVALEIGEPRSILGRAWFEKGRILSLMGACSEALEAYRQVPAVDVAGTGSLISRAQERIDEIRFGGFQSGLDVEGRCGLPEPEFERSPGPRGAAGDSIFGPDSIFAPDSRLRRGPDAEVDPESRVGPDSMSRPGAEDRPTAGFGPETGPGSGPGADTIPGASDRGIIELED